MKFLVQDQGGIRKQLPHLQIISTILGILVTDLSAINVLEIEKFYLTREGHILKKIFRD